ncbi:hypothetical protein MMYC01_203401 [Madurella mycetomatis]|uniref:Uncharacterized protein n=1 Tax=Madurella mycetomatis TaxID=100816 RepID=A0A175WAL7_9PEZI|nr:hypothetical protein MMYC01_203401 [Madurella mycetomatis]
MKFVTYILLPLAASAHIPDRGTVRVEKAVYSGNGCPEGSISISISPDADALTIGYDSFHVYIGPGYSLTEKTKNCAVQSTIRSPDGIQFAITNSTYHGYTSLDEGLTKVIQSTYTFSTGAYDGVIHTQISIEGDSTGAPGQVFTKTDSIPEASWILRQLIDASHPRACHFTEQNRQCYLR